MTPGPWILQPIKIWRYDVVFAGELDELIRRVNDRIGQGWQPYRGMIKKANNEYYQAMVIRYEK